MNGLVLTGFYTVGPLFGLALGFDQQHVVYSMACVSLGGLFLQWPIGYFSDKVDRLHALIGLGLGVLAVAAGLVTVDHRTPFVLIGLMFAIFGGLAESLYAVGVAHANDRADKTDYVALSSTLLFTWALGAAIGPTTGTYAMELISPNAFFGYAIVLMACFTLFAVWRLYRRKFDRIVEEREEFLTYPQTSPEIYAWLPYHRESADSATGSVGGAPSERPASAHGAIEQATAMTAPTEAGAPGSDSAGGAGSAAPGSAAPGSTATAPGGSA
jgi:MFS family permease